LPIKVSIRKLGTVRTKALAIINKSNKKNKDMTVLLTSLVLKEIPRTQHYFLENKSTPKFIWKKLKRINLNFLNMILKMQKLIKIHQKDQSSFMQ